MRKKRLVIYLEENELSLALTSKGAVLKSGDIFLREASLEVVRGKVVEFTNGAKLGQSLLVLPRSEVLQKELVLSGNHASLKDAMETKLEEALPYSRKEMAYSFSLDQTNGETKGLLLALPEKGLREKLKFLGNIGLEIDEIITEDQALLWLKDEKDIFLIMDSGKKRTLLLCGKGNQLLFSRSFANKSETQNILPLEEVSLALLEKGLKPARLYLTGSWAEEDQNEFNRYFGCPVEKIGGAHPLWAEGAVSFGSHPYLSLLPEAEKIRKKTLEKKCLLLQVFGSFALLFAALICAFIIHLQLETLQISKLETELHGLLPGVKATKDIQASLKLLNEAQASKEKLLELLKDLAVKLPSQVTIKELSAGPKDFFFKGESTSHGLISEAVDIFSRLTSISEAKLGETRLRKKLSEEYFEFEVTGKWVP